jgi:hypothetical protein
VKTSSAPRIVTTVPRNLDQVGLAPGCPVEVRTRFDGRWVGGFRVVQQEEAGFLIARCRDGSKLPELFSPAELRPTVTGGAATWPASA